MRLTSEERSYGAAAKAFHWLMALLFLGQIGVGVAMSLLPLTDPRTFSLYQTHKSLGVALFGLAALRLAWRLFSPPPPLPAALPRWQHVASRAVHDGLYFAFLAMPLIGWVIVSASPYGIPTIVFGLFELPHLGFVVASPHKAMIGSVASWAHWALAWAVSILILGHIAAAMAHHFIWKDDVLRRMLPFAKIKTSGPTP
jgi:cytochrome b561